MKIQAHMDFVDRITRVGGDLYCGALCHFESGLCLAVFGEKEILEF